MAMWSEILGGLGAAGGGYAQALERVKMQNLDEKTQREEQAWRDEESQRRTTEEQARIAAQGQRDVIAADRYAADQLAQGERDTATETERLAAAQFRIDEAQRDADAADATATYRGDVLAAAEGERPPENHAIVSGRGALERTKNENGSWNPAAAKQYLEEQYQGDVALPELIRGLNHVLVIEMERAQDTLFEPLGLEEVHALTAQGRREYEERLDRFQSGEGRQTIGWGDRIPPPPPPPDSLGVGGGGVGPNGLPLDTLVTSPTDTTNVVPIARATTPSTPSTVQLGLTNPRARRGLRSSASTNYGYGNMLNPNTTTTAVPGPSRNVPGVPDLSRDEAQRELDELTRRIGAPR
jgi:hypothetical protein